MIIRSEFLLRMHHLIFGAKFCRLCSFRLADFFLAGVTGGLSVTDKGDKKTLCRPVDTRRPVIDRVLINEAYCPCSRCPVSRK